MQVSQRALAYMLLWSLVCGAALGVLYDLMILLRRYREALPPTLVRLREKLLLPSALRFIKRNGRRAQGNRRREWMQALGLFWQDVLLCLLFAVVSVLLLYYTNDGQWRMSVTTVMLLSFFGYRATLGRPMRFVLLLFLTLASSLLAWITAILVYPVRLVWRLLEKPRRALMARVLRLHERFLSFAGAQREKRAAKRNKNDAPDAPQPCVQNRRPPDGRTVFSRGGYKPMN